MVHRAPLDSGVVGDVVPERAAHSGARMASLVEVVHEDPPQQPRRAPPPVPVAEPFQSIVDGVVGHLPADHPHPRILAAEQGAQRLEQLLLRLNAERGALAVPHVLGVHPEGAEVVVLVVAPRRKALEELAFEARNKPGKSGYAIASPSHS